MANSSIVGKWVWKHPLGEGSLFYDFSSDGTYNYYNSASGVRWDGTYLFSGNEITISHIPSTRFVLKDGNLDQYRGNEFLASLTREGSSAADRILAFLGELGKER
jgi:hypothetical protein